MATRKILPGNYCNDLSNYNEEALLIPGMTFHEYVGTAKVTDQPAGTFMIYDRDKQQPLIPIGAMIYRLDLDVPTLGYVHSAPTGVIMASVNVAANATTIASSATPAIVSGAATAGVMPEAVISTTSGFTASTANTATVKTVQLFAKSAAGAVAADSTLTATDTDVHIGFRMVYVMPEVLAPGEIYKDYRALNAKEYVKYP